METVNMNFQIESLSLPGVKLIKPKVFGDSRGYFLETYRQTAFAEADIPDFVQHNQSFSEVGVLRGLHYQLQYPQGKLIRLASGKVIDVALDIRQGSPTFGQSISVQLDAKEHHQLYVPPGFAHGFYVLEAAEFIYQCTEYYHPEDEYGVLWSDKNLNVNWHINQTPTLSEKDEKYSNLCDIQKDQLPIFNMEER